MWKDFFYYSKSERRAILFLTVTAAVLFGVYYGKRRTVADVMPETALVREEVDSFVTKVHERKKRYEARVYRSGFKTESSPVNITGFNPNTVDSVTLRRLGLSAFTAGNVLKYRKKGGKFRTPDDFGRMYGLSPELFGKLKPYIVIPAPKPVRLRDTVRKSVVFQSPKSEKYPEGTVVDLNRADTATLKRVPGIGSRMAYRIVSYRERLGGFFRVEQLQEISYAGRELNRWFSVGEGVYRKIEVNRAGLDRLKNHPYMDFYKAKAIMEYRRKRGKIKGLSRLSLFEEFSEKDLELLSPYLAFD